jgi:hypothetical protein
MKISEVHAELYRICMIEIKQHSGAIELLSRMDQ